MEKGKLATEGAKDDPRNLRTALILGSIALAVFFGFIARYWYLGQ